MIVLYSEAGLKELRRIVHGRTLFAFDLDGTLAPIVADPALVRIPELTRAALVELNSIAPLAVISGRSRADALERLMFNPQFVVGNHGAEGLPGKSETEADFKRICVAWEEQLKPFLAANERGILFENKGCTLSLHYRGVADPVETQKRIVAAIENLTPPPRRVTGKFVENVVAHGSPDKGDALRFLMQHTQCSHALFVGDDTTDEDAFRLCSEMILGIRVGLDAASAATAFLQEQGDVQRLLLDILQMLGSEAKSDAH